MKTKHLITLCFIFALSAFGISQEIALHTAEKTKGPGIVWETKVKDFGKINQGVPVTTRFVLTNNGTEPVIIEQVRTSCGCTASEYPKEPVAPGKSATIKVKYNAKSPGAFSKSITVYSNAKESITVLRIKGEVGK